MREICSRRSVAPPLRSYQVIIGSDLRRYRKLVGLTQTAFARVMGVAQTTLSQIESGRIGVSSDHLERLRTRFVEPEFSPSFDEFCRGLHAEHAGALAATRVTRGIHQTLTVWAWDERFDLGREPLPDQAAGLVTVEAGTATRIALRMGKATEWWETQEILVFEEARLEQLAEGELCLVQLAEARFRGKRTAIAIARPAQSARQRVVQFQPISPRAPMFSADESLVAVFRTCYRGRCV